MKQCTELQVLCLGLEDVCERQDQVGGLLLLSHSELIVFLDLSELGLHLCRTGHDVVEMMRTLKSSSHIQSFLSLSSSSGSLVSSSDVSSTLFKLQGTQ